jgi:hypothetical protein
MEIGEGNEDYFEERRTCKKKQFRFEVEEWRLEIDIGQEFCQLRLAW